MADKIMTLTLATGSYKTGVHNTTPPNYREMTRPDNYYGPLLQTNYEKTTAKVIPSPN